jgi:hypothetical protein
MDHGKRARRIVDRHRCRRSLREWSGRLDSDQTGDVGSTSYVLGLRMIPVELPLMVSEAAIRADRHRPITRDSAEPAQGCN